MHEIILKIGYFERGLSKSLKKFNFQTFSFFFQTWPLLMNKVMKKQKLPRTSDQLLFWSQNKFRTIPLSVMYYLTQFDDVI